MCLVPHTFFNHQGKKIKPDTTDNGPRDWRQEQTAILTITKMTTTQAYDVYHYDMCLLI